MDRLPSELHRLVVKSLAQASETTDKEYKAKLSGIIADVLTTASDLLNLSLADRHWHSVATPALTRLITVLEKTYLSVMFMPPWHRSYISNYHELNKIASLYVYVTRLMEVQPPQIRRWIIRKTVPKSPYCFELLTRGSRWVQLTLEHYPCHYPEGLPRETQGGAEATFLGILKAADPQAVEMKYMKDTNEIVLCATAFARAKVVDEWEGLDI
ncbi:uncharacterized protein KY384_000746 [Bacidia gigantensis]|uniref:uncharacterized protein n=1 Tax=Bacidia gigantensis TaxID=2732470 RepID=UPI001D03B1E4|nr:uncharacterized protein KY384_000746 [Bacidia gigantensis]KAG8525984.1 hypothetical protein KY384_000746 [Bacidia gigantensis]